MNQDALRYSGFWSRVGAGLVDVFLLLLFIWPVMYLIYGPDYWSDEGPLIAGTADLIITWILPTIITLAFWIGLQATPGKLAIKSSIVDARTGAHPGAARMMIRYVAYLISMLPLGLGFWWIAFDKQKRGWHDIIAGTVVVESTLSEPVRFEKGT